MTEGPETALAPTLETSLDDRGAVAFVHAGRAADPSIRYCCPASEDAEGRVAVAYDGRTWRTERSADGSPASALAARLAGAGLEGTVLTPAGLPHDAALFLEDAGFALASSDALARARASKTAAERDRIVAAQEAARAGIRAGASLLADATPHEGRLAVDGEVLTRDRLRTAIDRTVVDAGAVPAVRATVETAGETDAPAPGDLVVLGAAPREPSGYHGGLVRTLVVDGEGGLERRAHVAATRAFESARAMLTAGVETVAAVEADLEAEVRAFGFGDPDAVETRVSGVGLEPRERPLAPDHEVDPGTVVRLEATVRVGDGRLGLADGYAVGEGEVRPLAPLSRSLEPSELVEE